MIISGVSGSGIQPGAMEMGAEGQADAVSKDLQKQIEQLQKQMKELSANQEMPMEVKMKKRQELQKQISDLEVQLRQHQMEVKREAAMKKREEKGSMDDLLGTKKQGRQGDSQGSGMSAGSMEALISADTSMKQAGVHGSTAKKMEGRANVLETEIQLDRGRGGSSNADFKEEELARIKETAQQATASQMESLAQASEAAQNAAAADKDQKAGNAKTGGKDQKDGNTKAAGEELKDDDVNTANKAQKTAGTEEDQKLADAVAQKDRDEDQDESKQGTFDIQMPGVPLSRGYQPVDVRL
ncbi:MAG: FlxA-like family protein [Eubacterium sp.]|nr:FlxA-like family protein [Eubacterium sp.]